MKYILNCHECGQEVERSNRISKARCFKCKLLNLEAINVRKQLGKFLIKRKMKLKKPCDLCGAKISKAKCHSYCSKVSYYTYFSDGKLKLSDAGRKRFPNFKIKA